MPPYSRSNSKLLHQELMTLQHVVDEVFVVRTGLIRHAPASIKELQSSLRNKLPDFIFVVTILIFPPKLEELHLNLTESFVFIKQKLIDDVSNKKLNPCPLDIIGRSREILINSLKPANIVMRVRYQMNYQWTSIWGGLCHFPAFDVFKILLAVAMFQVSIQC